MPQICQIYAKKSVKKYAKNMPTNIPKTFLPKIFSPEIFLASIIQPKNLPKMSLPKITSTNSKNYFFQKIAQKRWQKEAQKFHSTKISHQKFAKNSPKIRQKFAKNLPKIRQKGRNFEVWLTGTKRLSMRPKSRS
jgi:hypothetical protein